VTDQKMQVDFLIIGQGLAGSLLAFELNQRGVKVFIIDNGLENASQVAAGLINPVTGMRFVKAMHVDFLLPTAKNYYHQLEKRFQKKFYVEKPMLRFLNSSKDYQTAVKRLKDPDYADYLGTIRQITPFKVPLLEQQQTAYLLTTQLLASLKQFFVDHQCYRQHNVAYQAIKLTDLVEYQTIKAKKIIFCEGYLACHNPWFSELPFQLVKGEILTLRNNLPLVNYLCNYGQWMMPLSQYDFRTGATFDRQTLNTQKTSEGRDYLLHSLHAALPETTKATLITQQANVRPCTLDKQPFIGLHSHYRQLAIFNGFGAKGSLHIPYYCQQFSDYLLNNKPLSDTVDIKRYYHF